MLEIDGSDGGGQVLRSSLALAAVLGRPIRVQGIRGDRPEPGLKPQHRAAVTALSRACDADTEGVELGSTELTFRPNSPSGGHLDVEIATAGAITLVFDTLLPLVTVLDSPLTVTATGGTEVKWAPPLQTDRAVKLPLCRQYGIRAFVTRHRTGFYPRGGGNGTLTLIPSQPDPLEITDRGDLVSVSVYSRESRDLAAADVASRQASTATARLEAAGLEVDEQVVSTARTHSTGSALTIALAYEETRAGVDELGEPGKPAEDVAGEAVDAALAFHEGSAAVDRLLADQLLVLLALCGGTLRIPAVTAHVETSLALLETFGFDGSIEQLDTDWSVAID